MTDQRTNFWDHIIDAASTFSLVAWSDGRERYSLRSPSEFNKSGIRVFDVTYYGGRFAVREARSKSFGPRCVSELGDPGETEAWSHVLPMVEDYLDAAAFTVKAAQPCEKAGR